MTKWDPAQEFCAHLRAIGVDARPAGPPIRERWGEEGEWRIDIAWGPIRKVLIWQSIDDEGDSARREISYLVPDSRIRRNLANRGSIRTTRIRRLPILGPVMGVRWKPEDRPHEPFWSEVVGRLSEDNSTMAAIAEGKRDLTIRLDLVRGCWVLTEGAWNEYPNWTLSVPKLESTVARRAPSHRQWEAFRAIAHHLLATATDHLAQPSQPIAQRQQREEPLEEAWAEELRKEHYAEARQLCATLGSLGIDAQALEQGPERYNPDDDGHAGWIEVAEGPIRWVALNWDPIDIDTGWLVPDARIGAEAPRIRIHDEPVESFSVIGGTKGVRWVLCDALAYQPDDVAREVAENLNNNTAVTQKILLGEFFGLDIDTDPVLGCWRIWGPKPEDVPQWSGWWECYQAIAEALLAMPVPKGADAFNQIDEIQYRVEEATRSTDITYEFLRYLGLGARKLGLPQIEHGIYGFQEPWGWIQIPDGLIRWVAVRQKGTPICVIPDSRIKPQEFTAGRYNPFVSLESNGSEWTPKEKPTFGIGWDQNPASDLPVGFRD